MHKQKHCERCGNFVEEPYWVAIFLIEYTIYLDSPHVRSIDSEKQEVEFTNGQRVDYLFRVSEDMAVMPAKGMVHLLCSENCEDEFLSKNRIYSSDSMKQKSPVTNWSEAGIYNCFTAPINKFQMETRVCESCGEHYHDFPRPGDRKWLSYDIINQAESSIVYQGKNPFNMREFDQVLTSVAPHKPQGRGFAYKLGQRETSHSFCTYDCAQEYVKSENVMIVQDSILEKDRIGNLSPHTEIINHELGNGLAPRPTYIPKPRPG